MQETLEKKTNTFVIYVCGLGLGYVLFKIANFVTELLIEPVVIHAFKYFGM